VREKSVEKHKKKSKTKTHNEGGRGMFYEELDAGDHTTVGKGIFKKKRGKTATTQPIQ